MASATATVDNFPPVVSVQELIKQPFVSVPQSYVQSDQGIFKPADCFPSVPTIDLKLLLSEETAELELEKLHSTCKEWGLFQLVNHGVSSSLLENMRNEIQEFYNLPLEEKMKYKRRQGDFEGNNLESYILELQKLSMKLVGFMAKALKIDRKEMEEMFDDGMQSVGMAYYPPCPQPELVLGISPHSDAAGITILNQINGMDGLQVKKDGVWIPVSFLEGSLVVNVGDILEVCHI
ncbi:hypothetical protein GH714_004416 [Hevea brasiliensis]|uniref:Fe2OG dioxygenase domain-containing protein n=1 Tax=Hevea brasiliensis TaxID=3981 RepID=A0A6A6LZ97_HEVBR|nr:hypothetical protein GH714_004416 [Hevea brasiliensis]